eukprot:SAG11_NODE_30572_length_299_cov_2.765000_1_plen_63_part_10
MTRLKDDMTRILGTRLNRRQGLQREEDRYPELANLRLLAFCELAARELPDFYKTCPSSSWIDQ